MTVTNIMSQLFIFSVMSRTINEAFTFLTTSATLAYLIPYIVSSIYSFKVIMQGDTYELQKEIEQETVSLHLLRWDIQLGSLFQEQPT